MRSMSPTEALTCCKCVACLSTRRDIAEHLIDLIHAPGDAGEQFCDFLRGLFDLAHGRNGTRDDRFAVRISEAPVETPLAERVASGTAPPAQKHSAARKSRVAGPIRAAWP